MKDVKGEGNCFWRAVADQYTGNENNYKIFKEITSNYLQENKAKYVDINSNFYGLNEMI